MKNNISHDTTGGQEMGERAAGGQDGWETIHVCCGEKWSFSAAAFQSVAEWVFEKD